MSELDAPRPDRAANGRDGDGRPAGVGRAFTGRACTDRTEGLSRPDMRLGRLAGWPAARGCAATCGNAAAPGSAGLLFFSRIPAQLDGTPHAAGAPQANVPQAKQAARVPSIAPIATVAGTCPMPEAASPSP